MRIKENKEKNKPKPIESKGKIEDCRSEKLESLSEENILHEIKFRRIRELERTSLSNRKHYTSDQNQKTYLAN